MFIGNALAATENVADVAGTSVAANIIQILLIFLVFYLLLIRPQQKKMKQHEAELTAIKAGDKVITGGGLYATVKECRDDELTLELSEGLTVKANRWTIREVLKAKENAAPIQVQKNKKKKK